MRFLLLITVSVAFAYPVKGQSCNCENSFEWVKKTFEENDAGFQYIIDKKGQAAYDIHNQLMLQKVNATKTVSECAELLSEWLTFFRKGHLWIEQMKHDSSSASQTFGEPEMWSGDVSQFVKYINAQKDAEFEGIWEIGPDKIGIKKEGTNYVGFIVETKLSTWKPGQIKLRITQEDNELKTTYIGASFTIFESKEPKLFGKNYMQIVPQLNVLKRLSPVIDDPLDNYFNSMYSRSPYIEELNTTTLYLRIPSFGDESKSAIDKVLSDNREKILKTENLIIDLRNNGGGSDVSYTELLPFLYTNSIRNVGVEFLSTIQNNQRLIDFATKQEYQEYFDDAARAQIKEHYEKLQTRLGEFVRLSNNEVSITKFDTIYDYPKNIGIIINENNGSTAEQFLLAAKQSKKVKLFGSTTFGALDISNMYFVDSPCKEYRLHYCLSRSMRLPDMAIDDIGLQPDYYLDKTVPDYKWVEFVNDILNQ
jgi:hypothetical protein